MNDLSLHGNLYRALQAQLTGKNLKSGIGSGATFLKATTLALAETRRHCFKFIIAAQISSAVLKQPCFNPAQSWLKLLGQVPILTRMARMKHFSAYQPAQRNSALFRPVYLSTIRVEQPGANSSHKLVESGLMNQHSLN